VLEQGPERAVEGVAADLQQQVGAAAGPLHLLALGEALADHGVDRALGHRGRHALALSGWQTRPAHGTVPGMTTSPNSYCGFRFPAEMIEHAVWLYHCFSLSLRDVELILAARGIVVSYERAWFRICL